VIPNLIYREAEQMPFRIRPLLISFILTAIFLIGISPTALADVRSLELIDAHASIHGEIAKAGLFHADQAIDIVYIFNLDATSSDTAAFTWDVYNRYDRLAHSGSIEKPCEPGMNTISIPNAIPTDLGTGTQSYRVYASVIVGDEKQDTEFEIRIESPQATPGIHIEDVRLTPREDRSGIAEEMENAGIPYTLEIDFRTENIISWAHAQIRWLGMTATGFELDRGIGSMDVDDGFNTFEVDSYIARPPYGSQPDADFSVEVVVFGYVDSVTFPVTSLPISLMELRSREGVENQSDFSVGEAYLYGEDGARTNYFQANEKITARILTGGSIPENTTILMELGKNEIVGGGTGDDGPSPAEQFSMNLQAGTEMPAIDYELPNVIARDPAAYDFKWAVIVGESIFAERRTSITISGREGIVIPTEIELPGGIIFSVPLTWNIAGEAEPGLFATLVTPEGITCKLLAQSVDSPLNVGIMADIFEDNFTASEIPSDATLLTTETDSIEGTIEYLQRAYLGGGKVFVHDYWLVRVGEGEYVFVTATSTGDENSVEATYSASETLRANLDLGV